MEKYLSEIPSYQGRRLNWTRMQASQWLTKENRERRSLSILDFKGQRRNVHRDTRKKVLYTQPISYTCIKDGKGGKEKGKGWSCRNGKERGKEKKMQRRRGKSWYSQNHKDSRRLILMDHGGKEQLKDMLKTTKSSIKLQSSRISKQWYECTLNSWWNSKLDLSLNNHGKCSYNMLNHKTLLFLKYKK